MFNGDNSSSCVEGRGRQGSQREPCAKQATIEMEMRLRGAHSEEELAKSGWTGSGSFGEGARGSGCQDSVPLQTAEPLGSVWLLKQNREENAGSFFSFTISQFTHIMPGEIFFINRWRNNHMLEMQISVPSKSVCN